MIDIKDVLSIQRILIDKYGGSHGVRDMALLESACFRPYMTFDDEELYKLPEEKSAAIFESLVTNHPFVDGNKRIGYVIMRLMLMNYKKDVDTTENEKYDFVIDVASGNKNYDEILHWIKKRLK